MKFENKKVLVTGGAGFIGSNFIRLLLEKDKSLQVINLDKLTYAGNIKNLKDIETSPRYRLIQGDIADSSCVSQVFRQEKPDMVFNFAAESHVDRSIHNAEPFVDTNIKGTLILLEESTLCWKEKKDFLYIQVSTDEVYGSLKSNEPSFTEKNHLLPNSPYAASKASADLLVRSYFKTKGLPVLISRCSNNYGPYQYPEKLIPLTIINILLEKTIPVYGDGKQIRDWIHVQDHCEALYEIAQSGRSGEIYNVGGLSEEANLDVVELICDLCDEVLERSKGSSRSLIKFVQDRPGHDVRYAMDITKIKSELGWNPKISFKNEMKNLVSWYLNNKNWWAPLLGEEYKHYFAKQYGEKF